MAEEKKEPEKKPANDPMPYVIALSGFVIGLIVAYLVFPPTAVPPGAEGPVAAPAEAGFQFNQAEVDRIGNMLADYNYVQTGAETNVTYTHYEPGEHFVTLYYNIEGEEVPIQVTLDYKYLVGGVMEVQLMEDQLEVAKAQMQPPEPVEPVQAEVPKVYMFVMSYCPYGNMAEDAMEPVVGLFGEKIDLEPVYIIYDETINPGYNAENADYCLVDSEGVAYCSMHGTVELEQGVRELVIYDFYGQDTWADYVKAANSQCSLDNIDTCWKTVAEEMNLSVSDIESSYSENLYAHLAEQKRLTFEYQKFGSPSIVINGQDYSGQRTVTALQDSICAAFIEEPEECAVDLSGAVTASGTPAGSCG